MITYLVYWDKNTDVSPIGYFPNRELTNKFITEFIQQNNLSESAAKEFFILVEENQEYLI